MAVWLVPLVTPAVTVTVLVLAGVPVLLPTPLPPPLPHEVSARVNTNSTNSPSIRRPRRICLPRAALTSPSKA